MLTWTILLLGCKVGVARETGDEGKGLLDSGAECDLCGGGCVQHEEPTTREHVDGDIVYDDPPPMGGNHNACWAEWGVHTEEVGDEHWVHNMEHGGVVFLYNCPDGCDEEVTELTQYVTSVGSLALLTPYSEMPYRFAAVSWGWRLLQDCLDMDTMDVFYTNHVGEGPESSSANPPDGCM